jgi:XrtJ-associated TM-motif-TM protein
MIRRSCLLLIFALAGVALPVHAQDGCDDSPEDPTVVLALVAAAGAFASSKWATRSRKP